MSKVLKKYKARIFGDIYTLVSDEEDAFVLQVVSKVDSLMKMYAAKPGVVLDAKKIAVLVALQVTEELLASQYQMQNEHLQIEKITQLLNNIEASMDVTI